MTVATALRPVVTMLLGPELAVTIRCWDGSTLGPPDAAGTIVVRSPRAIRRLLYAPGELGAGRAYVAGELDIDGDIFAVLRAIISDPPTSRVGLRDLATLAGAARRLGAIGPPVPRPPEEARPRGPLHSKARDAEAIAHHYDVSNDFYRLVLGETMTYSCAFFERGDQALDDAQRAKYERVCRKLGLQPGMRLLDVGCGWGGMALHAAAEHGVQAVGITISQKQHDRASKRVAEAGLADHVEIRLQDYRDVTDGPFDAISSIGMFEHVGEARLGEYFADLYTLLRPEGRLLNHAISRPSGPSTFDRRSFMSRYVFPDGELHEVGAVVSAMQVRHFEVRDVESLREHYARTLRGWVANLDANWTEAVSQAGEARARIWRLYMAGCALNFEAGRTSIHQVLATKAGPGGASGLALTREW